MIWFALVAEIPFSPNVINNDGQVEKRGALYHNTTHIVL